MLLNYSHQMNVSKSKRERKKKTVVLKYMYFGPKCLSFEYMEMILTLFDIPQYSFVTFPLHLVPTASYVTI